MWGGFSGVARVCGLCRLFGACGFASRARLSGGGRAWRLCLCSGEMGSIAFTCVRVAFRCSLRSFVSLLGSLEKPLGSFVSLPGSFESLHGSFVSLRGRLVRLHGWLVSLREQLVKLRGALWLLRGSFVIEHGSARPGSENGGISEPTIERLEREGQEVKERRAGFLGAPLQKDCRRDRGSSGFRIPAWESYGCADLPEGMRNVARPLPDPAASLSVVFCGRLL